MSRRRRVAAACIDELLAVGELAGRVAAERLPTLRRRAARWVRRPPPPNQTRPFGLDTLRRQILALGYEPGRDLLVHSALVKPLQADLDQTIGMLRALVEPGGTLLMPTHPLLTRRHEGLPVYDVARSRSRMGLLTERLRRTPQTRRSPFPVAPVCALGPAAEPYTADFRAQSGGTPYGRGSPYHRLAEREGQALFLGIDFIRALTMEHVAFDLLREEHPVADYYAPRRFWVIDGPKAGAWEVLEPRKALERRLATATMRRMVLRSDTLRSGPLAGVPLAVLDAGAFLRWHLPRARARGWPYWTPPRPWRGGGAR